jgi:hypothetical protein
MAAKLVGSSIRAEGRFKHERFSKGFNGSITEWSAPAKESVRNGVSNSK